mmetsp:Transcript_49473/g.120770  ORF Transcript_49473/g.120770 Transcript_49473/m.120770 type:complete len:256 (+) Transcript_49473:329-1096(+)
MAMHRTATLPADCQPFERAHTHVRLASNRHTHERHPRLCARGDLVGDPQRALQRVGHEIGLVLAVVDLLVVQKRQEDSVDGRLERPHEGAPNEPPDDRDHDEREEGRAVDEAEVRREHRRDAVAEGERREADEELADRQEHPRDHVDGRHTHDVAHEQREPLERRPAEVVAVRGAHDVGVLVDIADDLLEAPEAAVDDAHKRLDQWVVLELLRSVHKVVEEDAYQLHDRDDEGPHAHRAHVVAHEAPRRLPNRPR